MGCLLTVVVLVVFATILVALSIMISLENPPRWVCQCSNSIYVRSLELYLVLIRPLVISISFTF